LRTFAALASVVFQFRVWPPHELRRPATQRSFAPRSVTFSSLLLRPHVPVLNCLPLPSPFGSLWVLAVWTLHGWSSGPSRRYLRQSFTGCLDPYPGCLRGALTRFFPRSFGLPQSQERVGTGHYPHSDFSAEYISGLQSFANVQASSLLATQVAPTDAMLLHGGRGVYIRAPYGSLPSHTPDMLAVRIGQLTAGDFHPIGSAALSAAPLTLY
jgi:hypothetical protein